MLQAFLVLPFVGLRTAVFRNAAALIVFPDLSEILTGPYAYVYAFLQVFA